jgi:hypothetical protein
MSVIGRERKCDHPGCTARMPNAKWERIRKGTGWFSSFKEGTDYCPDHVPDWVPAWRERREATSHEAYLYLEQRVKAKGEPYVSDAMLRATARDVQVACQQCGLLEPPDLPGWSSDWITLCCEVRDHHVRETGHQVAVGLWLGAVYGPEREEGNGDH